MDEHDWLAERFEEDRARLRAVAYRMLGSLSEADDAVQEAWLRLSRTRTSGVENLSGWLTTVVGRVCLDMRRSRRRREEPAGVQLPEPGADDEEVDPEHKMRSSVTRLASRCSSSSRRSLPQNGSRSSCMTFSPCRSKRSLRSWGGPRKLRGSSRAAPAAACADRRRFPTPTLPANVRSSTRSSPPRAAVTSQHCSPCWTRTS